MLERIRSGTEPRKFLRAEELGTMLYQSSRRPKNVILGDLSLVDSVCLRPFLECVALRALSCLADRGLGSMSLMENLTPWKSSTLIQYAFLRGRAGRAIEVGIVARHHGGRAGCRLYPSWKMCK
jgi:hypothetical protein